MFLLIPQIDRLSNVYICLEQYDKMLFGFFTAKLRTNSPERDLKIIIATLICPDAGTLTSLLTYEK